MDGSWEEKELRGGTGLRAKALDVVEGLKLATTRTYRPIILESDCLELISTIKKVGVNRSAVASTINEAKRPWRGAIDCIIHHIGREVNGVSHTLARLGCKSRCTNIWDRSGPDILLVVLVIRTNSLLFE
jgi:hypothetical protein